MKSSGRTTGKMTVYEEKAPYSGAMKIVLTLGLLILALSYFSLAFGYFFGLEKPSGEAKSTLLLAVIIYLFALWSFFNMKFRITGTSVEAVMPPFRYSVLLSRITEIKIIRRKVPWYIGWGLRLWGKGLSFVSMHKESVLIKKNSGVFGRLILTTQNPEDFIKKVKEKMEPHDPGTEV